MKILVAHIFVWYDVPVNIAGTRHDSQWVKGTRNYKKYSFFFGGGGYLLFHLISDTISFKNAVKKNENLID